MGWHVLSVPSSVKTLLRKKRKDDLSPIQKAAAAVRYFTLLAPDHRLRLARAYAAQAHPEHGCPGKNTTAYA
jgi:hypothetical protein